MIWIILYLIGAVATLIWCAYDLLDAGEFEFATPIACGLLWFVAVPMALKDRVLEGKPVRDYIQEWFNKRFKDDIS